MRLFAQRVMKSRRDDASKIAAKAAEDAAASAMQYAEEAIRRSEGQDDEEVDDGPAKCFAIFKAEGFGMLEAMSQVGLVGGGTGAVAQVLWCVACRRRLLLLDWVVWASLECWRIAWKLS